MKNSEPQDKEFDKKIKETFFYAGENIKISDEAFNKIKENLQGGKVMKKNLKKIYIAAAAAILSFTAVTGIIAASEVKFWVSHSSNLTEKDSFPDKETIKDELGYDFKYVKNFSSGYEFSTYNFAESMGKDENGNVVIEGKDAKFDYVKGDNKIYLNAHKMPKYMYESKANIKSVNYNDVEIKYSEYIYKTFPPSFEEKEISAEDKEKAETLITEVRKENPDAEDITKVYSYLTDEDIEAYKNGALMIAYGSKEIETMYTQHADWYEDGISYGIMRLDGNDIADDEFIDMAKEIIDSK